MISLNNREKINKSKIRVGRGIGSGKGKTSGRGVVGETNEMTAALAEAMEAHATAKPFEKLPSDHFSARTGAPEIKQNEKQEAFAEKFKSWRQQNEVR